jgi:lipopolysaccharide heptosyltransferase II
MKHFQARTEDKLRVWSNRLDYGLHKSFSLFSKEPSLSNVRNILVVELKRIGDILVATPTLRTLKRGFPNANVDVVVLPGMEEVLEGNPHINKVFSWDRRKLKENLKLYQNQIQNKYDLAVILHNGTYEVSKILRDANIPYRIGCTRVGFKEPKGYFLTKQHLPDTKLKHKIEDNLDVLKLINLYPMDNRKPEAFVSKSAEKSLKELLKKSGLKPADKLVVMSTVSYTHPTWSRNRFAELADKLIEKDKSKIIFVGTLKEKKFIADIRKLMKRRAYNWTGKTSIQELFALIKKASLVVGIDSSATNIAGAFNTPVITLFGAGDHRIWKPRSDKSIAIQRTHEVCTACMKSGCKFKGSRFLECMKALQVEDVLRAVDKIR